MALASLCTASQSDYKFLGFIVDHGVRQNSSDEAAKVADQLQSIGVEPRILRLDWSNHGDPKDLTNFEAVARRLRYQAMGKECYNAGIQSLLVGHHADDQAETILSRIISGYLGTGLAGIQAEAAIPECAGIYGVDGSGEREKTQNQQHKDDLSKISIESGGVRIYRPLLPFTKDVLVEVCRRRGVKWFEDPTNTDQKFTIRNTIRHLHGQAAFPVALQRSRLCSLALDVNARSAFIDAEVQRLFDQIEIELHVRLGKIACTIDQGVLRSCSNSASLTAMHRIRLSLLRKLIQLSTSRGIPLQDLEAAADMVFSDIPQSQAVQIGKVNIQRVAGKSPEGENRKKIVLFRQKPNAHDLRAVSRLTVRATGEQSSDSTTEWLLWDQRYWIRARSAGHHQPASQDCLFVRFLTPEHLGNLRKILDKQQRLVLENCLAAAKEHGVVWTLPAVVARASDREYLIALPSLRWHIPNHGSWLDGISDSVHLDIRYKSVDLTDTETHRIIS